MNSPPARSGRQRFKSQQHVNYPDQRFRCLSQSLHWSAGIIPDSHQFPVPSSEFRIQQEHRIFFSPPQRKDRPWTHAHPFLYRACKGFLFGAWNWPLLLVPRLTCVWLYLHGVIHLSDVRETDTLTSTFPFPSKSFQFFVVILYVSDITLQAVIKYVTPESVTSLGYCDT